MVKITTKKPISTSATLLPMRWKKSYNSNEVCYSNIGYRLSLDGYPPVGAFCFSGGGGEG